MEDYNRTEREEFKSLLIVSDQIIRNILTLNNDILQRIYNLSKSDMAQLQKAKEESIKKIRLE